MNGMQNDVQATPAATVTTKKLQPPRRNEKLKAERVQEMLKAMPGWEKVSSRQAVQRLRELPDAGAALAYGAFVLEMARGQGRRVTLTYDDSRVSVMVHGVDRVGLTEETLLFAGGLG